MSWDDRVEVLLSVCSLDCRSEEASKGCDNRCKDREDEFMQIDGAGGESLQMDNVAHCLWECIKLRLVVVREWAIGMIEGAVEMRNLNAAHDDLANDHCADTTANEALPALVGRKRSQRLVDEPVGEMDGEKGLLAE